MNKAEGILERIRIALNAKNDTEIAKALGIRQPSVASVRKQDKVPPAWIQKIAEEHSISADWLIFGIGSKDLDQEKDMSSNNQDGLFLPKALQMRFGEKLGSLISEIIIKFENDCLEAEIYLPVDIKAKFVSAVFTESLNTGEINAYIYDTMLFFAKKVCKKSDSK